MGDFQWVPFPLGLKALDIKSDKMFDFLKCGSGSRIREQPEGPHLPPNPIFLLSELGRMNWIIIHDDYKTLNNNNTLIASKFNR